MRLKVECYTPAWSQIWEDFLTDAHQSTFLHSRKYLSYNEEKYLDKSLLLKDSDKIIGLFPAAQCVSDKEKVISHPGITYGGVIHSGKVTGDVAVEIWDHILEYYQKDGYKKLTYKPVPRVYHKVPCDDDIYAIFRAGANLIRADLSSAINLHNRKTISKRRERCLCKARNAGIRIGQGTNFLGQMWSVLEENLIKKHGKKPVHSLTEITKLAELFPNQINCTCAFLGNEVIAGVVTYKTTTCVHAQYIASNQYGYEHSALDLVFNTLIVEATENKQQWFDFGTCNENEGKILNAGLYSFKTEFGGGGIIHEHYQLKL